MSDGRTFGQVLERELERVKRSPRVRRWAREMLEALGELDEHLVTFAAVVGIGLVFSLSGYCASSAGMRELLEELAGNEVPR